MNVLFLRIKSLEIQLDVDRTKAPRYKARSHSVSNVQFKLLSAAVCAVAASNAKLSPYS